MKVKVKIGNRTFEVEVGDLNVRPTVATIDGQRFEVWLEATDAATDKRMAAAAPASATPTNRLPLSGATRNALKAVRAPIPGVIIAVSVKPGETVTAGQELCVLEAMKMKNAIRASHAGRIAAVRVSIGQHVAYHDVIMEYGD